MGDRCQLHQVLVALLGFGQKQLVIGLFLRARSSVFQFGRSQIPFHADDRLDTQSFSRIVKLDRAVHDSVIGDGHRFHLEIFGLVQQLIDIT